MNLKFYAGLFSSALLAAAWSPASAQSLDLVKPAAASVPELRRQAQQASIDKNYAALRDALEELHRQRPNNSDYMYQLVLAYALLDDKQPAFNIMLQMQRQGLSYDFNQAPESANLRGLQLYDYLNDLMVGAGQPVGVAEPVVTLDSKIELPETIAWDPQRERFLVGTITHGQILAVSKEGDTEELLRASDENGIWGIQGLAVDAERNRLWVSSAANPQFSGYSPVDKGKSILFEFRLDDMELLHRYWVPVDGRPHSLGKLAVAPDGDVYAADALLPMVYVKEAEKDRLRPFFAAGSLVSLRGLALSDDGKMLYVADYEMGVAVIDIEAGQTYMLNTPNTLNLGGIDGLNFWQGQLVVIQSGIRPQRLMSLELDENRLGVSNIAPLAVALDSLDYPSYGTVVGDDLYFFANTHRAGSGDEPGEVTIARTPLDEAPQIIDPEAERLFEKIEQARQRGDVRPAPGQETGGSETAESVEESGRPSGG